ncbi:MAG: D-alanyl-D-alanine carboxypeptidase, partial [Patescibacteria group bacterium]|nr:D-alanyl-D-alanine carboxypeptidase [Patescibacteria group bacterium]
PIKQFFQGGSNQQLVISAKSALSYDLSTNKTLFSKNIYERVPMASLTKIMTSIVALEHPKKSDHYLVTSDDLVGEDSMGLSSGEILSLKELLYGLILHSGNDAAETIATNFPGGREEFIKAMNEKATSLGLKNTHFTNPTGLEGDGNQFTTAYDLLVITRFALDNFPTFKEVVATFNYDIPATSTHKEYYLENETNLLTSYPGVEGVKTGYTPEAGLCLVTYLEYKNHKILAVLLGSDDRRQEMKDILDYSLKQEGITPPQHS